MNATTEQTFIAKLKALSPEQITEVEDFMDFIAAKRNRRAAAARLVSSLARLDALASPPPSDEEIQADVQAARSARRSSAS
jgi:hypothetical protein